MIHDPLHARGEPVLLFAQTISFKLFLVYASIFQSNRFII